MSVYKQSFCSGCYTRLFVTHSAPSSGHVANRRSRGVALGTLQTKQLLVDFLTDEWKNIKSNFKLVSYHSSVILY